MRNFLFWQKWLLIVSILITIFGLFMVFFNGTDLFDIIVDRQYEPVFWENVDIPHNAILFQQWAYGAWGATMAGWGITLIFIAQYPYKKKEKWAWSALLVMLFVWYVLDTSVSLLYKVYINALLNTVFFIVLLPPLIFTRKEFK